MNTSFITTGKPKMGGAVFRAPKGTTLPTNATGNLAVGFLDMGFISDDGVTHSNSPESDKIKSWDGTTVLVVSDGRPDTYKLKFLESYNSNVLETMYGAGNVTVDGVAGTIAVDANSSALDEYAYVIEMVGTGGTFHRIVLPCASMSEVGDVVYKNNEAVGFEITLECLPDSSGNTHYEYIKLPSGTSFALALDKSTLSVAHGSTSQITATTTPAGMRVAWGTSDATKATVDQNGLVTGVAAGSATITATFAGITKTCTVTVT